MCSYVTHSLWEEIWSDCMNEKMLQCCSPTVNHNVERWSDKTANINHWNITHCCLLAWWNMWSKCLTEATTVLLTFYLSWNKILSSTWQNCWLSVSHEVACDQTRASGQNTAHFLLVKAWDAIKLPGRKMGSVAHLLMVTEWNLIQLEE
jgi:hypothetical protein